MELSVPTLRKVLPRPECQKNIDTLEKMLGNTFEVNRKNLRSIIYTFDIESIFAVVEKWLFPLENYDDEFVENLSNEEIKVMAKQWGCGIRPIMDMYSGRRSGVCLHEISKESREVDVLYAKKCVAVFVELLPP